MTHNKAPRINDNIQQTTYTTAIPVRPKTTLSSVIWDIWDMFIVGLGMLNCNGRQHKKLISKSSMNGECSMSNC